MLNSADSTVSVIAIPATDKVSATIPVGKGAAGAGHSTPDSKRAYVANYVDGTVSVIHGDGNRLGRHRCSPGRAAGVAATPDGKHIYVSNQNDSTVSVLTTSSGTVSGPSTSDPSRRGLPNLLPDGRYAYVANNGRGVIASSGQDVEVGNTVSVIDTVKGVVSDTITVGNAPVGLAVTPDGKDIDVANVD